MQIQTVGVIGAGVMGIGVAHNLAQSGIAVILIDITDSLLLEARQVIKNNIRFERMFNKETIYENVNDILGRVTFTTDIDALASVRYVIENVPEKWNIKNLVYLKIDQVCNPDCIFAANTSATSITRIASLTRRAHKVIGTHFMNPVPMKSTVEVVRGYHTSDETLDITQALLTTMGKTGIVVNDMPGFVSNRVLMLTLNEAIYLLQDQVASTKDIDTIFKSCFGHKMGPLETADLIGLDTVLYSIEMLYESYNDSKYRPCPLLKKMVDAGLYGRKSGRGFYVYQS